MFNRILAPLDGSKQSECSLGYVKEIATGCHVTEVVILTVLEPTNRLQFFYPNKRQEVQVKEEEQAKEAGEKYLAQVEENLKSQGFSVKTILIQAGLYQSAAEAILNYADNNQIDLIVMTTHGRSGITRWAFGNVSERVVRSSRKPVLTITPEGCRVGIG